MKHCILITGSMGAGKTSTMAEASDLLVQSNIPHAAIDLDALGVIHLDRPAAPGIAIANLQALCRNYASLGIERLLLAAAVESRAELEGIRLATAAHHVVICRLRAPIGVMEARVAAREQRGVFAERYHARVAILEQLIDAAALEDFVLSTAGSPVTDVARRLLQRAEICIRI